MFFPQFTQPQQIFDAWRKMVTDHISRLEALEAQFRTTEEQTAERTTEAIDEAAKLMKTSLSYTAELGAQWRKQTLEATKQAASMMTPGV